MGIDPQVFAAFLTLKHVIIIVFLYIIGMGLKKYESLKDNYIPVILTLLSLGLCLVLTFAYNPLPGTFQTTMQTIYSVIMQTFSCVAAAVYFNQIGKQLFVKLDSTDKKEDDEKSE